MAGSPENIGRVIRAATIDDEMFDLRTGLYGDALQGAFDKLSLIERRRYDADLHADSFSGNNASRLPSA